MPTPIKAGPTKAFFVRMLTRDIELADAILDLLDNCVDGVLRQLRLNGDNIRTDRPYAGYWARIHATPERFEIWDNCGGIPREIAENSAFMLGRLDTQRDEDLETVGMYGIGMKRAMFKMGRHCYVKSQPDENETYVVEIPPTWLTDNPENPNANIWTLQLVNTEDRLEENGTKIEVAELYDGISNQFNEDASTFLDDLKKEVSRHYALILEKGFSVSINGFDITPVQLSILAPRDIGSTEGSAIEPYVFVGDYGDVHVELAVGFHRRLATEANLDDEELVRTTRDDAGWTIICNDRVVLYNDKTMKTGWGTGGVPGYHNQFISIAGVVTFRSPASMNLPLNTTKRGVDTSSELYQVVLTFMQEGLKKFTSFTNHWKRREDETNDAFEALVAYDPTKIAPLVNQDKFAAVRRYTDRGQGRLFTPNLPRPEAVERSRRICFSVHQTDLELVARFYFDNANYDRTGVGKRCFEESLNLARERLT